jgi:hypothetical protein
VNRSDPAAASPWLAASVAALVALGAQTLLESVLPASLADLPFMARPAPHVAGESFWPSMAVIRVASFAVGGMVGVLLSRKLSRALLVLLVLASVLCTILAQFPVPSAVLGLVVWSLAAPVGVTAGAWATHARRTFT